MSKPNETKTIKWADVLKKASEDSGIAKNQLQNDCNVIMKVIEELAEKERPKKVGESTSIRTPFCSYNISYLPSTIGVDTKTGKKYERGPVYGVSVSCPTHIIDVANTGISLEKKYIEDSGEGASSDKAAKKKGKAA